MLTKSVLPSPLLPAVANQSRSQHSTLNTAAVPSAKPVIIASGLGSVFVCQFRCRAPHRHCLWSACVITTSNWTNKACKRKILEHCMYKHLHPNCRLAPRQSLTSLGTSSKEQKGAAVRCRRWVRPLQRTGMVSSTSTFSPRAGSDQQAGAGADIIPEGLRPFCRPDVDGRVMALVHENQVGSGFHPGFCFMFLKTQDVSCKGRRTPYLTYLRLISFCYFSSPLARQCTVEKRHQVCSARIGCQPPPLLSPDHDYFATTRSA